MAYTKPLTTTTVYYHNGTDPVVFEDAISGGVTVRYGTTAKDQILHGDTVDAVGTVNGGDPTHYIIPYQSVLVAIVSVDDSESQTKPEDAFCVKE